MLAMRLRVIIMARYIHHSIDQNTMVVINFHDHLQPGTFEYTLNLLFDSHIDLSYFDEIYGNDETGRPAYNPGLLLKIILFAYYKGITSSREIEWCCANNITFMALACQTVPHWTTIAAFVSSHGDEVTRLFESVLLICDQQGLLGHELIAIDGCKMPSNASKEWSGTFDELQKKQDKLKHRLQLALARHKELDARGESDRAARHLQAAETLAQQAEKVSQFLAASEPKMGQGKRPKEVKSNITDNESAKMKTSKGTIQGMTGVAAADKKHQVIVDAQAFGQGQEQHTLMPVIETIRDRYQRLGVEQDVFAGDVIITADTGFSSEDNIRYLHDHNIDGYVPDNQFRSRDPKFAKQKATHGHNKVSKYPSKIPAIEFEYNPVNQRCFCPEGKEMRFHHEGVDANGNTKVFFEGRLAECRQCHRKQDCMRNPDSANDRKGHGRQVSFIVKDKASYTDWMRSRIDTERGKQIYSHRMSVIEPVFGNLEHNKGLRRFSLRSQRKVNTQWQLYCLVHNLEKLHHYGQIAA